MLFLAIKVVNTPLALVRLLEGPFGGLVSLKS